MSDWKSKSPVVTPGKSWKDASPVVDGGSDMQAWLKKKAEASAGEPGVPGVDQYKTPPQTAGGAALGTGTPAGDWSDFVKSGADSAALGAGPQIAGIIGALGQLSQESAEHPNRMPHGVLDAYRDVRDESRKELGASKQTLAGQIAGPVGALLTPIPVKGLGPKAPFLDKVLQGQIVGGVSGAIEGGANSSGDLTSGDAKDVMKVLYDAAGHGAAGAIGGAAGGAILGGVAPALRSMAEEQALRAAGLQAGIKNSLKTDLGLKDMTEARQLGRRFLDEDLIPVVGSSEAVAKRAERLQDNSGEDIGAIMRRANDETMSVPTVTGPIGGTSGGRPSNAPQPQPGYDFSATADRVRKMLDKESAVADELSGQKARSLADTFERQDLRTPGDFAGANQAKSDAWKSANFSSDAKMSPQLYRKAVGTIRDDIERQVGDALGPEAADKLSSANEKHGVAADALKLAENESTRRSSRKAFTTMDALGVLSGSSAGGAAGHPGVGTLGGLGAVLGLKAADKYGHSTASRFSDFLANQAGANSGGVVGGATAQSAVKSLEDYLNLMPPEKKDKLAAEAFVHGTGGR